MDLQEYRQQQQQKAKDTPPEPGASRPVYRLPFPVAESDLPADSPLRNLLSANQATALAEKDAEALAQAIASDQGLNPAGRTEKLAAGHRAIEDKYLKSFDEVLAAFEGKVGGERATLVSKIIGACAPDAVRANAIVQHLLTLPPSDRRSVLAKAAHDNDTEAVAAAILAPKIYGVLDERMRTALTDALLAARGGERFEELRRHEEALAVVATNRESSQRRIRDRLLGSNIPMTDEAIKRRLVRHDNNTE